MLRPRYVVSALCLLLPLCALRAQEAPRRFLEDVEIEVRLFGERWYSVAHSLTEGTPIGSLRLRVEAGQGETAAVALLEARLVKSLSPDVVQCTVRHWLDHSLRILKADWQLVMGNNKRHESIPLGLSDLEPGLQAMLHSSREGLLPQQEDSPEALCGPPQMLLVLESLELTDGMLLQALDSISRYRNRFSIVLPLDMQVTALEAGGQRIACNSRTGHEPEFFLDEEGFMRVKGPGSEAVYERTASGEIRRFELGGRLVFKRLEPPDPEWLASRLARLDDPEDWEAALGELERLDLAMVPALLRELPELDAESAFQVKKLLGRLWPDPAGGE